MRGLAACALAFGWLLATPSVHAENRTLTFKQLHTGETLTVTYKRNGRYDSAGLRKINYILRDWRRNESTTMDPRLLDLIWEVRRQTGSRAPINVISGFRSPVTNATLRSRSSGVAKNSQHMVGKALDFYLPDVPLSKLREIALQMQQGGVGFYPTSGSPFVHLDTGNVRHWPRMTRQQLASVFPDGKTVHIPSDGKPMPGYQLALAELGRSSSSGRAIATASAGSSSSAPERGRDASAPVYASASSGSGSSRGRGLLAALFGSQDEEEESVQAATTYASASQPEPAATAALANAPLPRVRPVAATAVAAASDAPLPMAKPTVVANLASPEGDTPVPGEKPLMTAALAPGVLPRARPLVQAGEADHLRMSPGAVEALMALAPNDHVDEELPFSATFTDAGDPPAAQQGLIALDLTPTALEPYVTSTDCLRGRRLARLSHPDQSDLSDLMATVGYVVVNVFDKGLDQPPATQFSGAAVAPVAARIYRHALRADADSIPATSVN